MIHNGTSTSVAAAESIRPHASTLRQRVGDYVRSCGMGGATAEEIESALGLSGNTIRPRLVELRKALCVFDSGRCRHTKSGRLAVVWMAGPRQMNLAEVI